MIQWIKNLWNLNKLLYKLQLSVDTLGNLLDQHQIQLEDLRQAKFDLEKEIKKLKSPIPQLDTEYWAERFAKARIEAEAKDKTEVAKEKPQIKIDKKSTKPFIAVEDARGVKSTSNITKVNRYYDPQMGVEYFDFEINGDKASPEDGTVRE